MLEHLVDVFSDVIDPWGYVVVFVLSALEAAAFVGLILPSEGALLLGGFLASQGRLSLWPLIAVAIVGAIAGDSIGYEIGRHLGPRLERSWAGRKVGDARWERARAEIKSRGPHAVLLGRFVGFLRAMVPAVAGNARMPYRSFLTWNVLGAVIWAPASILIGFLAGESYRTVARVIGWGTLGIAVVCVGGFVLWRRRRRRRAPDETEMTDDT